MRNIRPSLYTSLVTTNEGNFPYSEEEQKAFPKQQDTFHIQTSQQDLT